MGLEQSEWGEYSPDSFQIASKNENAGSMAGV